MDDARWLDDYLSRIRSVRWLAPDAAMDALDDSARAWIAERVEEHTSALTRLRAGEPVTLAWRPERAIDRARDASGHVSYAGTSAEFSLPALAWLALLDDAKRTALRRAEEVLGTERRTEVAEAVWAVLRASAHARRDAAFEDRRRHREWDGGGEVRRPDDLVVGATGGAALVFHALWTLSADAEAPSPWAPLLALWERGVCPLAALDGAMIVYVPLRDGHGLVGSPETARDLCLFSGGIGPLGYFDDGNERLGKVARAALLRFNQHGFGPLPEMYRPVNVSDVIMATNWPGPPDPYVHPPPASVDAASLDATAEETIRDVLRGAPGAPAPPPLPDAPPPWYERARAWFRRG